MTAKGCSVVLVVLLFCEGNVLAAEIACPGTDSECGATTSRQIENEDLQVIALHTSGPVPRPKSLNMMAEDLMEANFRPTPLPLTSGSTTPFLNQSALPNVIKSNSSDEPRGRALNFTLDEKHEANNLAKLTNSHDTFDLSDVTISDNEEEDSTDMIDPKILVPSKIIGIHNATSAGICEKGGLTYENGEKLENGCDEICTCIQGTMDCEDRCTGPFFRKGKRINDPLCSAKDVEDPCCSIMVCAGDTETEPLEMCSYNNKTYNRGDTFNKDCSEACICEIAGKISCKPRCPQTKKTSDRCVEVPDPIDACCKKVLCDVTLDDQDHEKEEGTKPKHKLISAAYVNSSVIHLEFEPKYEENETLPIVEVTNDKKSWSYYQLLPNGQLFVRENVKFLKLENAEEIIEIKNTNFSNPNNTRVSKETISENNGDECKYKGKTFKNGEEYNDGCESLCMCHKGEMKCLKLECPTYFGVEVLDAGCVEWETIPPNFKASPPNCCPEKIRCKNNGSCVDGGRIYKNWDQLPINVTGCEKRCYCEMGKIECQNTCPPVPALPPPNLACPPKEASLQHIPDDDCCMYWVCSEKDDATRPLPTKTKPNKKDQNRNKTTDRYFGTFSNHIQPSRVFGPLTVYANGEAASGNTVNHLSPPKHPEIIPNENPFYKNPDITHNPITPNANIIPDFSEPLGPNILSKIPSREKNMTYPNSFPSSEFSNTILPVGNKLPEFLGSLVPNIKKKPQNTNKTDHNWYPTNIHGPPHSVIPPSPTNSPIAIYGEGNADDLLQFLQQHPEITNLPSGSVLKVHSLPPKVPFNNQPHISSANDISLPHPNLGSIKPPLVPGRLHPEQGSVLHADLSLEQILEELHKNISPQGAGPLVPFPHRPPYFGSDNHQGSGGSNGLGTSNKTYVRPEVSFNNHYPDDFSGFQQPRDDITVHALDAVDAHTIRLAFMVPPVIVGLHGRVEVRYTISDNDDINSWELQVFAPPNDLIATPSLEFDLHDLVPDKEYRIKITITLRDLHNAPSSRIYKIRTPKDVQTTTLPPQIPIEPDMEISDINATWVTVVWRKFTEYELQFIDGVQLRYKETDGKIYAATPLIHRAVTTHTLENLKSNTKYEMGIFFIPFPGQRTELHAEHMLQFTTANEVDTYSFSVALEISHIKSTSVEIAWSGVPYPEDKYVNIYRAIYQSDSGKEDHSTFKMAKRDSPTKTIITDLKPGTRYRLWLEVYLTNGKIKTSNVQDLITKPRSAPALGSSSQQDKLSRAEFIDGTRGDYYGPLVIVAILAAIAILSTLILLLILVRRHNQNKAAITPPTARISQSAYDNPTYKVEIQQETMGL